jgi:hypothetical protein
MRIQTTGRRMNRRDLALPATRRGSAHPEPSPIRGIRGNRRQARIRRAHRNGGDGEAHHRCPGMRAVGHQTSITCRPQMDISTCGEVRRRGCSRKFAVLGGSNTSRPADFHGGKPGGVSFEAGGTRRDSARLREGSGASKNGTRFCCDRSGCGRADKGPSRLTSSHDSLIL